MINIAFAATQTQTVASLRSIERTQRELANAQVELSTGRKADIARDLGAGSRLSVSLRTERSHLSVMRDGNVVVSTRLETTDVGFERISLEADRLLKALVLSSTDQPDPSTLQQTARQGLAAIEAALNTTSDGTYVFGGINMTQRPIAAYFGEPAPPSRQAVAGSFSAAFGVTAEDTALSTVGSGDVSTFLSGDFAALFASSSWDTTWSSADNEPMMSRISPEQVTATNATANAPAIRDVMRAFVMIADLGISQMNPEARAVVTKEATQLLGSAVNGLTVMRAAVGSIAASVQAADEQLRASIAIIDKLLDARESVDPAEVSTRLTSLMRDLEASYSVVARLSKLSLLERL